MDKLIGIVICVLMLALWIVISIRNKKKHGLSAGQLLTPLATTFISIALLLNAFDLVSRSVYLTVIAIGLLIDIIALILIIKQDRF